MGFFNPHLFPAGVENLAAHIRARSFRGRDGRVRRRHRHLRHLPTQQRSSDPRRKGKGRGRGHQVRAALRHSADWHLLDCRSPDTISRSTGAGTGVGLE